MAENEAIGTIAGELLRVATEHGYEGPQDLTIAGAIDALADTLAGENVDSGQTIAEAVRALAPYVGAGSGGGFEPKGMNSITISEYILGTGPTGFNAGTNEPSTDGPDIAFNDANVCQVNATEITICGGLNVLATVPLASGVDADSVGVFLSGEIGASEVPSTKKVLTPPSGDRMLFIAFKTPEAEDGTTNGLSITNNSL